MSIKVCGIGVISSIGVGCNENFNSLINHKSGIGELSLFESSLALPVGEIKLSNSDIVALLNKKAQNSSNEHNVINAHISRTALLGAIAAKEAVESADIPSGKRVGLISSTTVGGMDLSESFYKEFKEDNSKGRLRDIVGHHCASSTDFIAQQCGIEGFRTTISTACSSAVNAVIMGAEMLKKGMLDYVVVGGTDSLCSFTLNGFNSLMILDSEPCKPLDANRKGLNLGEGAGYIVLTNDTQCNNSLCYLRGYANANDAYHQTASSAEGNGAFMAMEQALNLSGIKRDEVDYINLHGTGTPNNDSSELAAVKRVFGESVPPCSSTKSYTGHTLAASGGVESVYSVLAITRGALYGSLRFTNAIEGFGITPILESRLDDNINCVLSNSFGFGGNCSSIIFSK